jgi:hypothetical protein
MADRRGHQELRKAYPRVPVVRDCKQAEDQQKSTVEHDRDDRPPPIGGTIFGRCVSIGSHRHFRPAMTGVVALLKHNNLQILPGSIDRAKQSSASPQSRRTSKPAAVREQQNG